MRCAWKLLRKSVGMEWRGRRGAVAGILGAFLLLGLLRSASGAVISARTADLTDVAAAVSLASNGDTVTIPAGNAVWGSSLTITKSLTIRGAGTNLTKITRSGDILILEPAVDQPIRITGIYFSCGSYSTSTRSAVHFNRGKCTSFRIDHCRFDYGKRVIWCESWSYGVIDHNFFYNPDLGIAPSSLSSGDTESGSQAWARPIVPGTVNTVCIEDNTFVWDSGVPADPNEFLYGQDGGRATFRRNFIDATKMTAHPAAVVDAHGYDASWGRGTIMYEVYDNTFSVDHTYRFCNIRGGSHLFFNNTFLETDATTPDIIMLKNEGQAQNGSPSTKDVITNSHFWNNTYNGAPFNPIVSSESRNLVVINRDYFTRAPQSGDAFYPYTPLVYPHPTVTAQDGGTSESPIISVTPPSLNYGSVAANSASDLTVTIQNVGGGVLSGTATVSASFSIVGSNSYSLAAYASQLITVRFAPNAAGNFSGNAFFSGGGGATVSLTGSAWIGDPPLSFAAPEGTVTSPFTVASDNTIAQVVTTIDPAAGGLAAYNFNITVPNRYAVLINVDAPADDANSFFVNIDAEPVSPNMIWDVPLTSGLTNQLVTWRGSGAVGGSQAPQAWFLSAGSHQLIIRGREERTRFSRVTLVPGPQTPANLTIVE
jgi:hypothetical protein